MSVTVKLPYLRIAPRKVRLLADLIRGKGVSNAQTILNFTTKKASGILLKLLNQAVANAKKNLNLDASNLYISKILVNEGPKLKRFRPRARGSAYEIQKKTSHIIITLDERGGRTKAEMVSARPEEKIPEKDVSARKVEKKKTLIKPKMNIEKETLKPKTGENINKIFRRQTF